MRDTRQRSSGGPRRRRASQLRFSGHLEDVQAREPSLWLATKRATAVRGTQAILRKDEPLAVSGDDVGGFAEHNVGARAAADPVTARVPRVDAVVAGAAQEPV